MAGVEIKDTTITTTGHSDRQIAIGKLADAMFTLAEALKAPDGAQYGVYVGNVTERARTKTANSTKRRK